MYMSIVDVGHNFGAGEEGNNDQKPLKKELSPSSISRDFCLDQALILQDQGHSI